MVCYYVHVRSAKEMVYMFAFGLRLAYLLIFESY